MVEEEAADINIYILSGQNYLPILSGMVEQEEKTIFRYHQSKIWAILLGMVK